MVGRNYMFYDFLLCFFFQLKLPLWGFMRLVGVGGHLPPGEFTFAADALEHFRAEGFFQQNVLLVHLWPLGEFPGHSCLRSACLFLIPEISRHCFLVVCVSVWDFSGGCVLIVTLVVDLRAQSEKSSPVT